MSILKTFPGRVAINKTHLGPADIIGADAVAVEQERNFYRLLPANAHTLRFEFGDRSYDPTEHWSGRSGTWTKLKTQELNIWEWSYADTNWHSAFGRTSENESPFIDAERNPVRLLAAGDTSDVTDFGNAFAYAQGLVEVCKIDTSAATNVSTMFSNCWNVSEYSEFDFRTSTNCTGVFQCCISLKKTPKILLPTDHTVSLQNMFSLPASLEEITPMDTSSVTNMSAMFAANGGVFGERILPYLDSLNIAFVENDGNLYMARPFTFGRFKTCPAFDTSSVTNMSYMFAGTSIEAIPDFDFSHVTNTEKMFDGCHNLRGYFGLNLPAVTKASLMFASTPNLDYVFVYLSSNCNCSSMFATTTTHNTTTLRGLHRETNPRLTHVALNFAKVANATTLFKGDLHLVTLPDLTGIPANTSTRGTFNDCRNAKYGILEAYTLLSSQGNPHDNETFKNCGIDTEEGRKALEQIPKSWGGLKSGE